MGHQVFISYHHTYPDQDYRNRFENLFARQSLLTSNNVFISRSVQMGDISPYLPTDTIRQKIRDEYLRKSTVTIVLIGENTWQRKHVDWEIGASIRQTIRSSRSGLLGIILPSHSSYNNVSGFNPGIIPPRLYDNYKRGYAKIYNWTENKLSINKWIEDAYSARSNIEPDNSYPNFINNKFGNSWK